MGGLWGREGVHPETEVAAEKNTSRRHIGAYGSTFLLTLTNPMTILSFAAIFAGLGVGSTSGEYVSAGFMVLGVFIGSALWWCLLSGFTGLFHGKPDSQKMSWINKGSGAIVTTFGVIALISIIY